MGGCQSTSAASAATGENDTITYKRSSISSQSQDPSKPKMASDKSAPRGVVLLETEFPPYVQSYDKTEEQRSLIYKAIKTNLLFQSYDEAELNEIVRTFEPCVVKPGEVIMRRGEKGDFFYIVQDGELSVGIMGDDGRDTLLTENISSGQTFGELALMYSSPRAATITALTPCNLYRTERSWYLGFIVQHRRQLNEEMVRVLSNVMVGSNPLRNFFDSDELSNMAQLMRVATYSIGQVIIREGEVGRDFYIIAEGSVIATKASEPITCTLEKHAYFGEKALLSGDVRAMTCTAASDTTCYLLNHLWFKRVMGNLEDIFNGKAVVGGVTKRRSDLSQRITKVTCELKDLKEFNVLGEGAFGKVKLVKKKDSSEYYALKIQRKDFIVKHKQEDVVVKEYEIMKKLSHPNIVTMHCAMQDCRYLYFLMAFLPGGTLMDILGDEGGFSDEWIKFYSASVLLALNDLREKKIVHRDLKPENLVLDTNGYCILIDFGIAKRCHGPNYTICGTPDYIAPEVIRGTGYGLQVDYWALGILMFELHQCKCPFYSASQTTLMNNILAGSVKYPETMSTHLKGLIHSLLSVDPFRRLGCMQGGIDEVLMHEFFGGFDWKGLLNKEMSVPFKPILPSNVETLGKKNSVGRRDRAAKVKWIANLGQRNSRFTLWVTGWA